MGVDRALPLARCSRPEGKASLHRRGAEPVAQTGNRRFSISLAAAVAHEHVILVRAFGRRKLGSGDPQQAIGDAVGLSVQERTRRREQSRRELRGPDPAPATSPEREVGQAQLQRHPARGQRLSAQAGCDAIALREQDTRQLGLVADVAVKRRLGGNALRFTLGMDRSVVAALRQSPQTQAILAEAQEGLPLVDPLQIADHAKARALQPLPPHPADPPQAFDALPGEPGFRFVPRKKSKAARLVDLGGHFRQKLAIAEADRDRDANLDLDAPGEAGQRFRRPRSIGSLAAAEIKKSLVDRQRLDQRRELHHPRSNFAPDAGIFGHVGWEHDRVRAKRPGPRHRHRRAHPERPGDVAASRNDAARPRPADDQGLVIEARVVALFDRGVEGVAVDMGDVQPAGGLEADRSRRAAMQAAVRIIGTLSQTVAAEAQRRRIHQGSPSVGPRRASCARATASGWSPASAANSTSSVSSAAR